MATDRRLRALIDELLNLQEPAIRRAFIDAMRDVRDAAALQRVVDALARGDLAAAADAIAVHRAFFAPLDQALSGAYLESGRAFNGLVREDARRAGLNVVIRFDPGNPRAAGWLRERSSSVITEIVEDQRTAVREALSAGMEAGRNPRTVALDVTGRVDKATGSRAGGVIGLTSQQAQFVENARLQLLSGDPAEMRAYLARKLRDRRFDGIVRKAIATGRPVAAADVQRIVGRYSDRMVAYRGEVIARTEALTALSQAQVEGMEQLVEAGEFRRDQITKTWRAAGDGRTRDTHAAMNGQTVGMDGTFTSPSGARLRYPRDTRAPASETVQCRCRLNMAISFDGARNA